MSADVYTIRATGGGYLRESMRTSLGGATLDETLRAASEYLGFGQVRIEREDGGCVVAYPEIEGEAEARGCMAGEPVLVARLEEEG